MGRSKSNIKLICQELGLDKPLTHDKFVANDFGIDKNKIQRMQSLGLVRRVGRIGKVRAWVATDKYWQAVKPP